jgi:hypothetical protein
VNQEGKIHPESGWNHPIDWGPRWNKKLKEEKLAHVHMLDSS